MKENIYHNAYNNSNYIYMNIRIKQKLNRIMMEIKSIDRGNIYHNEYHKNILNITFNQKLNKIMMKIISIYIPVKHNEKININE